MGLPANKKNNQLQVDRSEMGKADSLRFNVMTFVVEENYDRAIKEIRDFSARPSEYPNFQKRIERYVKHSIDLVNAIRAKRKFPGMNSLTMSKQQELTDKYQQHFAELKYMMKKIEKINYDLRQEDIRSTVLIVKAFINALFAIVFCYLLIELFRGLLKTGIFVVDDTLARMTDWIFQLIGM